MMQTRPTARRAALALGTLVALAACAADPVTAPPFDPPGALLAAGRPPGGGSTPTVKDTAAALAAIDAILGPVPTTTTLAAHPLGPDYKAKFVQHEPTHRVKTCCRSGGSYDNYYDRVQAYYAWWAQERDSRKETASYPQYAHDVLVTYRDWIANRLRWEVEPHDAQLDGLALHYLVTGDNASKDAVARLATRYSSSSHAYFGNLGKNDHDWMDNRIQGRVLLSLVLAHQIGAPDPSGATGGTYWSDKAKVALNAILGTQTTAAGKFRGAYQFKSSCYANKPFMVGILNDALTRYHDLSENAASPLYGTLSLEDKARILKAVELSADYMWVNDWVASAGAFREHSENAGGCNSAPAPDLNLMVVSGYGWVGSELAAGATVTNHTAGESGAETSTTYFQAGDGAFAGGVNKACFSCSDKHFNQQYQSGYRYLAYPRPAAATN